MKKILSFALLICLSICCMMTMVGCGSEPEQPQPATTSVVEFSVNPEVQLILDQNNTVVNINCLTEETQMIFSRADFIGCSAAQAGELFVKIASDCGKIDISKGYDSSLDGTVVSVKIFCQDDKVFETLKDEIVGATNKFFQTYGIVAGAVADRMTDIKSSLAKIDESVDTNNMTEQQILDLLAEKSAQLKDVHFALRKEAIAGIEKVKANLDENMLKIQKKISELEGALLQVQKQYYDFSKELFINEIALNEMKSKISSLEKELKTYTDQVANVNATLQKEIEDYLKEVRESSKTNFDQDVATANEMFDNFKPQLEAHAAEFAEKYELIAAKIEVFQESLQNE